MTKQLILMRHAKSDWGAADLADHDRSLNPRGQAAAPLMARWLAAHHGVPEVVLCSTATRTRQTLEKMQAVWDTERQEPSSSEAQFSADLYLATPETILRVLRAGAGQADSVMVLAHNPGIEMLAATFSQRMVTFPTATVAVFEIELENWSQLRSDSVLRRIAFKRPTELS